MNVPKDINLVEIVNNIVSVWPLVIIAFYDYINKNQLDSILFNPEAENPPMMNIQETR
jgi:hypothetical protein